MRKIVFIIIIIGIIVSYLALRDNSPEEKGGVPIVDENTTLRHPDPSSATFIFNDGPVTLLAGKSEEAVGFGNRFIEETVLLDKVAYGDINADGKEDVALFLVRYGAGSGTFVYVASFTSGPITYRGSNVIFIGDRISPQSISIDNNLITVSYLGRTFDEPFTAEPTILTIKEFIYVNSELQER